MLSRLPAMVKDFLVVATGILKGIAKDRQAPAPVSDRLGNPHDGPVIPGQPGRVDGFTERNVDSVVPRGQDLTGLDPNVAPLAGAAALRPYAFEALEKPLSGPVINPCALVVEQEYAMDTRRPGFG